jgi:hypothetical protein
MKRIVLSSAITLSIAACEGMTQEGRNPTGARDFQENLKWDA